MMRRRDVDAVCIAKIRQTRYASWTGTVMQWNEIWNVRGISVWNMEDANNEREWKTLRMK